MARTKKTYSNGIAPTASATSATSWLPTKARSSKCALCSAEFEYMTTEEIEEHDLRCCSEVPPLEEHEACQSTEKQNLTALEPARESSGRLTTPPESVAGQASVEGSVADFTGLANSNGVVSRLDVGGVRDDEADGDGENGVQADENDTVVVKNDLYSSVAPYIGDELEFYEVENVRPGETRDPTESLTTPEPFSTGTSESVDNVHNQEVNHTLPAKNDKRLAFRKLTDMQELDQYLANPEEMSYDMLYHRTAVMVNVLQEYSKEYRATDREIQDCIALIKLAETEEKVPVKEQRRLDLEAKDSMHYRLYELYYTKLKALAAKQPNIRNAPDTKESTKVFDAANDLDATEDIDKVQNADTSDDDTDANAPLRGRVRVIAHRRYWQGLAEKLLEAYPQDSSLKKELAEIMYGSTLDDMLKRKKEREMPAEPADPPSPKISGLNLINVPPPKLDRETLDLYATRQPSKNKPSLEQTLENWEMQKMAAVYSLPLINGTVELRDRNGGPSREGRNGRPMRAVRQVAKYDTEQSEAPGTSSEDLPSKRRRNEGPDNTTEELPTKRRRKEEPTVGSPVPIHRMRTGTATRQLPEQPKFPSGNTIGRPRGSKTKSKGAESKLKESHLPQPSPVPERTSQSQEHMDQKQEEFQRSVQTLLDLLGRTSDPPKKGKHGGARIKGVSTKSGSVPPTKPVPRGKRVNKETVKKSTLPEIEEKEVIPSTELDDGSRFVVSRPTTSSSAGTAVSAGTHHSTRQSTREKSKLEENSATKAAPSKAVSSTTPKKQKRTNTAAQESIQVAFPNEMESTEDVGVSGRKRRKTKVAAVSKSQNAESFDIDEGTLASPVKGGRQRKTAGTKAPNNNPTKAGKKSPPKFAAKKAVYSGNGLMVFPMLPAGAEAVTETETEAEEGSESESESEVEKVKKSHKPAKAKPTKKRKRAAPELEIADDDLTEAELKAKKKKSEKLSESARKRWASGQMAGPMAKRQATVAAKKLMKNPDPIRPPPPTSAPHVPPPITTSAPSSGTRTSGRKRKPTSRALGGGDGADDSDSEEAHPFKSEYEHFQALSSPGTPALPKRRSKQMYNLAAFVGSEEDEDEDDYY